VGANHGSALLGFRQAGKELEIRDVAPTAMSYVIHSPDQHASERLLSSVRVFPLCNRAVRNGDRGQFDEQLCYVELRIQVVAVARIC
jgi:hypothetical protein